MTVRLWIVGLPVALVALVLIVVRFPFELGNWLLTLAIESCKRVLGWAEKRTPRRPGRMTVEVLTRNLAGFAGEAWLLRAPDGQHYVASGVHAPFSGWEVLVFPSDGEGNVTDWGEVAGGRGMSHEDAVADLCDEIRPQGGRVQ